MGGSLGRAAPPRPAGRRGLAQPGRQWARRGGHGCGRDKRGGGGRVSPGRGGRRAAETLVRGERGMRGGGAWRGPVSIASLPCSGAVPAGKEPPFQLRAPRPGPAARACLQAGRAARRTRLRPIAGGGRAGRLGSGIPRAQGALPDRFPPSLADRPAWTRSWPRCASAWAWFSARRGWTLSWTTTGSCGSRGTRRTIMRWAPGELGERRAHGAGPHQLSHVCFVTTPAVGRAWEA